MDNQESSSSERQTAETIPVRPLLPRETSKADIEVAEQLLSHSQGNKPDRHQQEKEANSSKSPSPYPRPSHEALPHDYAQDPGRPADSPEQSQRDLSYPPIASSALDQVPSGQACR